MTFETLHIFSLVFFILALAFFGISIVLFFVLDIKNTYGYLSGKNLKRGVEKIRKRINLIDEGVDDKQANIIVKANKTAENKMDSSLYDSSRTEELYIVDNENQCEDTTPLTDKYNSLSNNKHITFELEKELSFMGSCEIIE